MYLFRIAGLATIGVMALTAPALALQQTAPGPIAGIGLPAFALIGGAYWVGRKFFSRKK